MQRRAVLAGLPLVLAGCSAQSVWAPDDFVARVAYRHPGPPALSLYTMRATDTGEGAHTALMISASQRVMFDPAGSWGHETIPERNDVVFGLTDRIEAFYISYHARETFYVVRQTLTVPAATAELALQLALAEGPVPQAQCALSTSSILSRLPGIGETVGRTWFPVSLMNAFGRLPGVVTTEHREDDPDTARGMVIAAFQPEAQAGPGTE